MTKYVMVTATGVIWNLLDAPDPHTACVKTDNQSTLGEEVGRYSEVGFLDAVDDGYIIHEVPDGFEFDDGYKGAASEDYDEFDMMAGFPTVKFKREGPAMPWALEMHTVISWCMDTDDGGEGDLAWRVSRVAERLSEVVRETTGQRVGDYPACTSSSRLPEWMMR